MGDELADPVAGLRRYAAGADADNLERLPNDLRTQVAWAIREIERLRNENDALRQAFRRAVAKLGSLPTGWQDDIEQRPDLLTRREPDDGPEVDLPARPNEYDHHWLMEHFHLGSHDGSISCRLCRASLTLTREGRWHGRHQPGCTGPTRHPGHDE